jgi:hypothetical protein
MDLFRCSYQQQSSVQVSRTVQASRHLLLLLLLLPLQLLLCWSSCLRACKSLLTMNQKQPTQKNKRQFLYSPVSRAS